MNKNYNLYQNGILRVYSPCKGRDWSINWYKIDVIMVPIIGATALIIAYIKGLI